MTGLRAWTALCIYLNLESVYVTCAGSEFHVMCVPFNTNERSCYECTPHFHYRLVYKLYVFPLDNSNKMSAFLPLF